MKHEIDLRSDTVTKPTPAMRQAIAEAEVGDDVVDVDPTVERLERLTAEILGKEAALYMPSGSMTNQIAIRVHCDRGSEFICEADAHVYHYEQAAYAQLSGLAVQTVAGQSGVLTVEQLRGLIRPDNEHMVRTRLVCLENTHNRCGGAPLSQEYTRAVSDLAHQHALKLHLDGARIFNAAAAQGIPARNLAAPADSVTFCLSKGLCAPVGSVLCGSQEFIHRAHRIRKQLGGGMRQAGIIAAAGIIALESMVDRLGEDHLRAARLADGLRDLPGIILDPGTPRTNMIFLNLSDQAGTPDATTVAGELAARGVLVGVSGANRFRLVIHYWIDDPAVDLAVEAFHAVLAGR